MGWRNRINQFFSIGLLLLAVGCGNPEAKSKELYDTAQFEEQQRNFKHARQLYERILKEYPETETAKQAETRLKELEEK
ncbi:tetratricopeptide repeat protein [Candidatus Manganitrophus noduliformans]|uniref:Tetratricopeptide repeat protein n=1 Tax=Candidatus Manganitrophus noduliformans TaxID=2606439 RepID=A0A7X6DRB3_9BACT|nr:tetratricopeptide repeat protein [Candidatus Manganitrophus noduliformans]NKE71734.1 tetratricopeptide repeat protein [Candidatus Manganitrophus noduliformans]